MRNGEGCHVIHADDALECRKLDSLVFYWHEKFLWDLVGFSQIDGGQIVLLCIARFRDLIRIFPKYLI